MQDRTITKQLYGGTFQFTEADHVYTFDGKPVWGTTTMLKSVLAKNKLMAWYTTEPLGVMGWYNPKSAYYKAKDLGVPQSELIAGWELKRKSVFEQIVSQGYEWYVDLLDKARSATAKKMDDAAEWGSRVHEACEVYAKTGVITDEPDIKQSVLNFVNFIQEGGYTIKFCEEAVMSKEWWMGGTLDLILEKDGKMYIADIKTSSGIYSDMFLQMGFYDKMQYEMELTSKYADGYIIINLKKDSTINYEVSYLTEAARASCAGIVTVFKEYSKILESRGDSF